MIQRDRAPILLENQQAQHRKTHLARMFLCDCHEPGAEPAAAIVREKGHAAHIEAAGYLELAVGGENIGFAVALLAALVGGAFSSGVKAAEAVLQSL